MTEADKQFVKRNWEWLRLGGGTALNLMELSFMAAAISVSNAAADLQVDARVAPYEWYTRFLACPGWKEVGR